MIRQEAVAKVVNGVYLSHKAWDVINDDAKYISLEGVTGSLKSVTADRLFHKRVYKSGRDKTQFAIIGSNKPALERTIIQNPISFFNRHRYVVKNGKYIEVMKYKQNGTGGSRIEWKTPNGLKRIYLAGFDNKARYKTILGMTMYGFWADEIQTAHDDFITEMFTRLARDKGFLVTTSNAGLPDQKIYTDYLNKGRPSDKWYHDIPIETMKELETCEPDDRFRFYWFGFTDNPMMSDEDINDLYETHPVGSFEYNSKIIAIRGYTQGLLYAKYINDIFITKENQFGSNIRFEDINPYAIKKLRVGIDLGSTAKTVFVLSAFTNERWIVIDAKRMEGDFDYNGICEEFNNWILEYYSYFGSIENVRVDSADPLFIKTLRKNVILGLNVLPSKKYTIKERVTFKEQMLYQSRLLFTDKQGSQDLKNELKKVRTDGKGGHLDEGEPCIDFSDALDYSATPDMHQLMSYKLRRH